MLTGGLQDMQKTHQSFHRTNSVLPIILSIIVIVFKASITHSWPTYLKLKGLFPQLSCVSTNTFWSDANFATYISHNCVTYKNTFSAYANSTTCHSSNWCNLIQKHFTTRCIGPFLDLFRHQLLWQNGEM